MKKFITISAIILALTSNASAKSDWERAGSFALAGITSGGFAYLFSNLLGVDKSGAAWESFAVTTMLNAGKEFYLDEKPDTKDFTAQELGALVGVSISILAF